MTIRHTSSPPRVVNNPSQKSPAKLFKASLYPTVELTIPSPFMPVIFYNFHILLAHTSLTRLNNDFFKSGAHVLFIFIYSISLREPSINVN